MSEVIEIKQESAKRICKRLFDICLILLIFPFAVLLMLFVFVAIIIEQVLTGDYGPLLVTEPRTSRGREIKLLKLNMFKEGPRQEYMNEHEFFQKYGSHGMLQKKPEALRVIGPFMKKFYVDELGQILNILKGEMSIVGPRPQPPVEPSNALPPRSLLNTGIFCFKANKWKNCGETILQLDSDMDYFECYASSSVFGLIRLDFLIIVDGIRAIIRGEGL